MQVLLYVKGVYTSSGVVIGLLLNVIPMIRKHNSASPCGRITSISSS